MMQPERKLPKPAPHDFPMTEAEIVQWEIGQLSTEEPMAQRREAVPTGGEEERRGEAEGPPTIPPDVEAEKEAHRARELTKEAQEEVVERAVEKRFVFKKPPRTGRTHGTSAR